ncbi:DUF3667 domain-containing protein [uncultured Tenacibaculum sp.]|uniref:DUF3667 domain-containing protein n=1 Tax=uncultured Tenacibaculum sp. TaxID=174713 RepID=UPI0026069582|nr:DUF3667 domain-containing protein [uncultured Tenacibaculum sp.]
MNCKNCNEVIEDDALFCDHCGAKVLKNRITFRFLLKELFISLGWDSYFIVTIKMMFTKPDKVLREYINGIRKRYLNPFTYIAISAALSLIVFNVFSKDFTKLQNTINNTEVAALKKLVDQDLTKLKDVTPEQLKVLQKQQVAAKIRLDVQDKIMKLFLKYFNIFMFLLVPFYALISNWTYRKPYNYGEHIVMNSYLVGTSMYFTIILFFLAIIIHPAFYFSNIFIFTAYYLYTFSKLHEYNLKQSLLSLLRFILVAFIVTVVLIVIIGLIAILVGILYALKNPDIFKM